MFSKLIMGVCAVSMLSSACTTRNASQQRAENELTMLVGTYTSGNSKGIYTFRFNQGGCRHRTMNMYGLLPVTPGH